MPADSVDLLAIDRGTITAPAGCGKTHLIAQALRRQDRSKPVLVLTHTNAGVAALRGRLDRFGVSPTRYRLSTIDGWAMRLIAMFPSRSGHDPAILKLARPGQDYPAIRKAAAELLAGKHVDDILAASFDRLIVDEYQDCLIGQHAIVYFVARSVPTCVLGDPLQAIFDFAGALANWNEQVCVHFPLAAELSTPWRWKNAGEEAFGLWLLDVRHRLIAGKPIDLRTAPPNVTWIALDGQNDHQLRLRAARTSAPTRNGNVLIIAESTSPAGQRQIASQTPGAVAVESVDLKDLVTFAKRLDLNAPDALEVVVGFAENVMTNVGAAELLRKVGCLDRGTARTPPTEAEEAALRFKRAPSYAAALDLFAAIGQQGGVRTHRPGMLRACIRTLQISNEPNQPDLYEAAVQVREQSRLLGRPLPRRAVGSTLLLKGLEADVAVVLNAASLNRQNLYVAMTRGSKALVICSPSPILTPA